MGAIALTRRRWGTGLVVAILLIATLEDRPARAMSSDEGRPLLRAFTPRDYEGAARIDRLGILPDGTLVAACGSDIVTFDGLRFGRIETPMRRILAMSLSPGGTHIHVGGDRQLGVIDRSPDGSWRYRSTLESVPAEARPLGRVTSIATVGEDIWIATETTLLLQRGRSMAVVPVEDGPFTILPAGDELYVQREHAGLFRVAGDELVPVASDPLVNEMEAIAAFRQNDAIVLASRRHGLVSVEGGRARLMNPALAELATSTPPSVAGRAPGGGFVLGTEAGLIVVDEAGTIERRVTAASGLPAGVVTALALDRDGSVWAGTTEGVFEISLLGAVTRFDARDGLPRSAFGAMVRHLGRLVLAAPDGLYALQPGSADGAAPARFERLPARVSRPRDLLEVGGWLLVSGSGGIWRLEGAEASPVFAATGEVTDLAPWSADPEVVLAARSQGLSVLRREGGRLVELWSFDELGEVRTIAEDGEGSVWLGTTSRGIHRIQIGPGIRSGAWESARVTTYDASNGKYTEPEGAALVGLAPGGPLAIGPTHVYRYETVADAFRREDRFTIDGTPLNRLWPLAVAGPQRFWASASLDARRSDFPLARLDRSTGGVWTLTPAPSPVLEGLGFSGASPIVLEASGRDEEVVWAAGFGELYRVRSSGAAGASARPSVTIEAASGAGRMRRLVGPRHDAALAVRIPHSREPVRIGFGAASLLPGARVEYRWRLEGWNDAWSAWSASREAAFSSLPAGGYRFVVQARDRSGTSSETASLSFKMAPPPWLAWWAWAGYGLAAALVFWMASKIRLARAAAERLRLEELVALRTNDAAMSREAAEEAERAKRRFLARMGDELKAPIDGIISFANRLQHDPDLGPKYKESIGRVQASGNHLLGLLGEITELSRVESGRIHLEENAFSLSSVLRDIETAFVAQARERGIRFQIATRDLPRLPVIGDGYRLRQVLEHLIGGAMRLTERGEVRLTVIGEPRSGRLHFAVSDTGPGVAPEEPETELGLAMSRQIVELMGARLEVAAQPGEGSTSHFSITLPETDEEQPRPVTSRGWLDAARFPSPDSQPPGA